MLADLAGSVLTEIRFDRKLAFRKSKLPRAREVIHGPLNTIFGKNQPTPEIKDDQGHPKTDSPGFG